MSYNYTSYDYVDDSQYVTRDPDNSANIVLIATATTTALGCLCNGFVLLVLLCRQDVRTLPFLAVGLLALCDFVRNSSAILPIVSESLHNWIFGDAVCKITRYLHFCSTIVSSWHLLFVIITRYNWTFRPSSYLNKIRSYRMVLFSLILWMFVIVVSIPVVITYSAWRVPFSEPPVFTCVFQADLDKSKALIIADAVVRLCLPGLGLVVVAVITLTKTCAPSPGTCCTKFVIIFTPVMFLLLHGPTHALPLRLIIQNAFEYRIFILQQYADALSYTSTVLNPLLQAFSSAELRTFFSGHLCCAKRYNVIKVERRVRKNLEQNGRSKDSSRQA